MFVKNWNGCHSWTHLCPSRLSFSSMLSRRTNLPLALTSSLVTYMPLGSFGASSAAAGNRYGWLQHFFRSITMLSSDTYGQRQVCQLIIQDCHKPTYKVREKHTCTKLYITPKIKNSMHFGNLFQENSCTNVYETYTSCKMCKFYDKPT